MRSCFPHAALLCVAYCAAGLGGASGGLRSAHAELAAAVSVSTDRESDGRFRYEYLIENFPGSMVTINTFVLDVGPGAGLMSLAGPAEWVGDFDPDEDPFELVFQSPAPEFDIPIGGNGLFTFTSPLAPDPLNFFVANLGPGDTDNGSIFGKIDSPARFIPEPSTLALGILLTIGLPVIRPLRQSSER